MCRQHSLHRAEVADRPVFDVQDLVITAGADASIKLWHLADWLPGASLHAYALPALPAVPAVLPGLDRDAPAHTNKGNAAATQHAQHDAASQATGTVLFESSPRAAEHAQHGLTEPADHSAQAVSMCEQQAQQQAQHAQQHTQQQAWQQAQQYLQQPRTDAVDRKAATASAQQKAQQDSQQLSNDDGDRKAANASAQQAELHNASCDANKLQPKGVSSATAVANAESRSSKSEWVRCMQLSQQATLYLATNQGRLYSTKVPSKNQSNSPGWQHIYSSPSKAAIVSICIADQRRLSEASGGRQVGTVPQQAQHAQHYKLILGDIRGTVTVVQAISAQHAQHDTHADNNAHQPVSADSVVSSTAHKAQHADEVKSGSTQACWSAHPGHPVLAVFAPRALPSGHVLTVSVSNTAVHWWFVPALSIGASKLQLGFSAAGSFNPPVTKCCCRPFLAEL